MNFLQIVQRLSLEAGIGTGNPVSIASATIGMNLQLVRYVQRANRDLQQMDGAWRFNWGTGTFQTSAGTREYTAASASVTDLRRWLDDTFSYYLTADGASTEGHLPYVAWRLWRPRYEIGDALTTQDKPVRFTISPTNSVRLNPVPDDTYTVRFDYQRSAAELTTDSDTPCGGRLPTEHHEILVWKALEYYAREQEAWDVLTKAEMNFSAMYAALAADQLDELEIGSEAIGDY